MDRKEAMRKKDHLYITASMTYSRNCRIYGVFRISERDFTPIDTPIYEINPSCACCLTGNLMTL